MLADVDPLEAAERRGEALEPGRRSRPSEAPSALRERGGGDRVVDVVEAGEAQPHAPRPARAVASVKRDAVEPVELDRARDDVERRPRVPAGRAAVVAEVADVRGGVVVRRPAADAVLRVGRVLERRPRRARIVEAEDAAPRRDPRRARRPADRPRSRRARLRGQRRDGARASARRPAPARRSGRAGRGTGCRGRARAAAAARATSGSAPRRPRRARARASGARERAPRRRPDTRFAPGSVVRERAPRRRISATIAVVVVFPFVAETSADPSRQPRREPVERRRVELPEQLPGHRRPAAPPATRESVPTRRAPASSSPRGRLRQPSARA